MHHSAVTCRMCHRRFFPASLKFHVKVCAEKLEHINLPCDFCQESFSWKALQTHMKTCTRGHKRQTPARGRGRGRDSLSRGTSTPRSKHNSSGSSARQHRIPTATLTPGDDEKNAATLITPSHARATEGVVDCAHPGHREKNSAGEDCEVSNGTVGRDDGRVACANCRRKFSPDRVGVHQEICQRVNLNNQIADTRGRNAFEVRATSAVRSARRSRSPAPENDKKTRTSRTERVLPFSHSGDGSRHPTSSQAADTMCISTRERAFGFDANATWKVSSGTSPRAHGTTLPERSINHGTRTTAIVHSRILKKSEGQPEVRAWSHSRGSISRPRPSGAFDWASASAAGHSRRAPGRESSSWSPDRSGRGARSSASVWPTTKVRSKGFVVVPAVRRYFSCWEGGDDGIRRGVPDEAGVRALGGGVRGSPDEGGGGDRLKPGGAKRGIFCTHPRWT